MRRNEKIKVFCERNPDILENEVNKWLTSKEQRKKIFVSCAFSIQKSGMAHICITYR